MLAGDVLARSGASAESLVANVVVTRGARGNDHVGCQSDVWILGESSVETRGGHLSVKTRDGTQSELALGVGRNAQEVP